MQLGADSGALRYQQGWAFEGGQDWLRGSYHYESQDEHCLAGPPSPLLHFASSYLLGRTPTLVKSSAWFALRPLCC